MSPEEIANAWKDCAFRDSLTADQRAALPVHPAGGSSTDAFIGGHTMMLPTHHILTMGCCDGFTSDIGLCSWFCGSARLNDQTYGCCTPGR